jgi:hypothetical protein
MLSMIRTSTIATALFLMICVYRLDVSAHEVLKNRTSSEKNRTLVYVSGPFKASFDGQKIENMIVKSDDMRPAITVDGFHNVKIKNVIVYHSNGPGIVINRSQNANISDTVVVNIGAPERGKNIGSMPERRVNIQAVFSNNLTISNVYVEKGAAGVYLFRSDHAIIKKIEGFDIRGPLPRGQLVQFDKCKYPTLDTFSVINPGRTSWTEDAINSYGSIKPTIRNGYIEGLNSPKGVGVLIENGEGGWGGLVENVDVRYWVNGAFSAATDSEGVTFKNVRAYDGLAIGIISDSAGNVSFDGSTVPTLEQWAQDNFRGEPTSGQEAFHSFNSKKMSNINFINAGYFNLARKGRVAWDINKMSRQEFSAINIPPRPRFSFKMK